MPAPTVTITQPDPLVGINDFPTVTFTFSEAVSGFTLADVIPIGGFLDQFTQVGNGTSPVWTARYNPFPSTDNDNAFIRVDLAGVTSTGDGAPGVGVSDSATFDVDTVRPTLVSFMSTDTTLRAGETATVTVVFSEPVTLSASPFGGPGLTFSNIQTSDNITYTATLTPNENQSGLGSTMGVLAQAATDLAGNPNQNPLLGPNYTVNTIRPTLVITLSDDQLAAGETATVTFTFSEPVNGFDLFDDIANVFFGNLTPPVPSFGGPQVWTSTFTPFTDFTDLDNLITVNMSGVTSIPSGNSGAGLVQSPSIAIDTQRPTVTVAIADDQLGIGQTSLVTFTFSEAVGGFTNADVTVENGTLSAVGSGDGGVTWTANFTPTAGVNDNTNLISANAAGVTDSFGNAGANIASQPYGIDSTRPTLVSVTLPDPELRIGDSLLVTFVFSEAIENFTLADITAPNLQFNAPTSNDGVTWVASVSGPAGAVEDAENLISLNLAGLNDLAGNVGEGTATSVNYAVDTARPDLTVTVADAALAAGETTLVTFTFTEPVSGFDLADVAVENGTLSTPATSNGGRTWTATYTPNGGVNDATNVILVNKAGVTDAAGNAGSGFANAPNLILDSTAPTATIAISETAVTDGETPTVTVNVSEPMAAFTLVTPNGSVGAFTISNGGLTYTASFFPFEGVDDATNAITFAAGARDLAGNLLTGAPASANYTVNTSAPDDTTPPPQPPPLPPPSPPAPPPGPSNEIVRLSGSENSDVIAGTAERNVVAGGTGTDSISGDAGDDTLSGDEGSDNLQGNVGLDSVSGGVGDDTLHGGQDADMVQGGADNDVVFGDRGDDTVRGGQGDDQVFGGDGDDYLSGDRGSDTVSGGAGADTLHAFGDAGLDRILDFSLAEGDRVRLDVGTTFTLAEAGDDTVISLGGGAQVVLAGVQLASLTDGWIVVG